MYNGTKVLPDTQRFYNVGPVAIVKIDSRGIHTEYSVIDGADSIFIIIRRQIFFLVNTGILIMEEAFEVLLPSRDEGVSGENLAGE